MTAVQGSSPDVTCEVVQIWPGTDQLRSALKVSPLPQGSEGLS